MKLTLGYSPCPNDTFIFDALVNHKIDTGEFEFDVALEDVQTLNEWARIGKLDVSKISYGVLPLILKDYSVLDAGGALGKGVGPLLISRQAIQDLNIMPEKIIAIPGENTTAHVLFSLAFPKVQKKKFMIFSGIEEAVLNGIVDAGVIIHENRFTYQKRGLVKLMDLGAYWEISTGNPIPLGGIVIKRMHSTALQQKVDVLIRQSVQYAFAQLPFIPEYVREHSQEMDEAVMKQHIDLYVNDYSINLGEKGRAAVRKFLEVGNKLSVENLTDEEIFSSNYNEIV